jgi:hypothetical protein
MVFLIIEASPEIDAQLLRLYVIDNDDTGEVATDCSTTGQANHQLLIFKMCATSRLIDTLSVTFIPVILLADLGSSRCNRVAR